jgi:hypothetical protein
MWNMINNYIKNIVFSFGYNMLYLFSYLQIKYDKYDKLICYAINSINSSDDLFMNVDIYNIPNNIINKRIKYADIKDEKYDCIIITNNKSDKGDNSDKNNKSKKKIIQKYIKFPNELSWECTNDYFLSLSVMLESGDDCNIILESKKYNYNYRIVGNIIDENFIRYYLEKYHKDIIHENISYKIQLIGPTFEVLNLEMHEQIILEKDGYTIDNY